MMVWNVMSCNGIFTYKPLSQKRFGNLSAYVVSHTGQDFDYRFSTKPCNEVLNTYRFAYREYAPDTGRWLSQDPIFERGGHNLYAYCGNDPVNGYDPLGLLKVFPVYNSPSESAKSDLWFGVYMEFEKNESSGYLIVQKEIKFEMCGCDSENDKLNNHQKIYQRYMVSRGNLDTKFMTKMTIDNSYVSKSYLELASLGSYTQKYKGAIDLKFVVGFTKKYPSVPKTGMSKNSVFSPYDSEHGHENFAYEDNPQFKMDSKAELVFRLNYLCGVNDTKAQVIKKSGWSFSDNDRLNKNNIPRHLDPEDSETKYISNSIPGIFDEEREMFEARVPVL